MIEMYKTYGKLVRSAPNVVDVGDPAMIPVIYNIKGDFTKVGFLTPNGDRMRERK